MGSLIPGIDCFICVFLKSISVPEKFQPVHTRTSSFQRTLSPQGVHLEGLENYGVKYYHLVSTYLSAMFHSFLFLFAENVPFYTRSPSLNRTISPQDVHIDLDNYGVKYYHLVSKHLGRSSSPLTPLTVFLSL